MDALRPALEAWQQQDDDELLYDVESLATATAWQAVEDAARQAMLAQIRANEKETA